MHYGRKGTVPIPELSYPNCAFHNCKGTRPPAYELRPKLILSPEWNKNGHQAHCRVSTSKRASATLKKLGSFRLVWPVCWKKVQNKVLKILNNKYNGNCTKLEVRNMDEIIKLIGTIRAGKYVVVLALESSHSFIQAYENKKLCVDAHLKHGKHPYRRTMGVQGKRPIDKHTFCSETTTPLWRVPSCGYPSSAWAPFPRRRGHAQREPKFPRGPNGSRGCRSSRPSWGCYEPCCYNVLLVVDVYRSMRLEGNNIWVLVDVWLWCGRGGTWVILGKQLLNCLLYYIGGRYFCLRCSPLINEFMQSWRYKARVRFERVLKGLPYCHWRVFKEHAKGQYNKKEAKH